MSKSKWYEVTVAAWKTIVVEISEDSERDHEDEACEIARDNAFLFCDEVEVTKLELLDSLHIEAAKHHADEVCALDDYR